jgi:hypothetical protein
MNNLACKGALVLFCRSKVASNFDWVKPALANKLQGRFAGNIKLIKISTASDLVSSLLNPINLFDIDGIHLLAEYEPDRILIDAVNNRSIEDGKIADIKMTKKWPRPVVSY